MGKPSQAQTTPHNLRGLPGRKCSPACAVCGICTSSRDYAIADALLSHPQCASPSHHPHRAQRRSLCCPAGMQAGLPLPYRSQARAVMPPAEELEAVPEGPCRSANPPLHRPACALAAEGDGRSVGACCLALSLPWTSTTLPCAQHAIRLAAAMQHAASPPLCKPLHATSAWMPGDGSLPSSVFSTLEHVMNA